MTVAGRRAIWAAALSAPGIGAAAAQGGGAPGGALTPEQRREVLDVVREALRTDPSLLREALQGLQAAEDAELARRRAEAIAANAEALFRDPADPVRGNPRGDVTLVEFFDVRCGYCKTLHPVILEAAARDRGLRVVMKDFPILGPLSTLAARALLAAHRQGRHAELHDALMRLRGEPTEAALAAEMARAGVDWGRARVDMDRPEVAARIERNLALARALMVEGTPALVLGERLIPGAVDLAALERAVAEARARGRG